MSKSKEYIIFKNTSVIEPMDYDDYSHGYEINTKYRISDQDEYFYYLRNSRGNKFRISKQQKDIDYEIGDEKRPRS